jgi:hypothetical protein
MGVTRTARVARRSGLSAERPAYRARERWARSLAAWAFACSSALVLACQVQRAAVHLSVVRSVDSPRDASVYIDEEFVGFLGVVAARGVRLPEGEHRITVEKVGYFPWDRLVVSEREPISLDVALRKIPE